ncbi:heavy metal-associated isoprenylated plant protein 16-like [Juglans microcarpa x Juglans regia]|uniref:heavy metal-associated isoprenylated plant protein 16-like n=1 Tax=Juglans microcarpa x Juglans regia TaxID=2249226 RepID=UPI001B7F1BE0|nr:heavy metal-associated isoprenylated plant protein 16-like [Juglans microcarpa x Juglans regia]
MKQTVVIKVEMDGHKSFFGELDGQKVRSKALKIAVGISGVVSASLKGDEKNQIELKGEGIDSVKLTKLLRKKVGFADIITVADDKIEEKKEEPKVEYMAWPYNYIPSYSSYPFYAPSGITCYCSQ